MMEFATLGTGSAGNCSAIKQGETVILIDAGFSGVEVERRMAPLDLDGTKVTAILVTHEHRDHLMGVGVLARKYGCKVYIHSKSYEADTAKSNPMLKKCEVQEIKEGEGFQIGEITVKPFTSWHDAKKTLGYTFVASDKKVVFLTDCGFISNNIKREFDNADLIALEFNYKRERLLFGDRHWTNKFRTLGNFGHLDNKEAAKFVKSLATKSEKLHTVVAMHRSENHNEVEDIMDAFKEYCPCELNFKVADRDTSEGWITV